MGYVLASASLSKLVLAHDCGDSDTKSLGEHYIERSEEEIPVGLRWFYCAGLSVALTCMSKLPRQIRRLFLVCQELIKPLGIISLCHIHKEFDGQRIAKKYRLSVRLAVALILVFLPLAHSLNSLELVSITMSLVAFALIVELYGSTSVQDSFWKDRRVCKYSADCHMKKKDLETAAKTGQKIEISEISKGSKGEKAVMELS